MTLWPMILRVLLGVLIFASTANAAGYDPGRVPFTLAVKNVVSDLNVISVTAMPSERILVKTRATPQKASWKIEKKPGGWELAAGRVPGVMQVVFSDGRNAATLNVFVLTPWNNGKAATLNGYRIGTYGKKPLRNLETYRAPTGFIEFNPKLADLRVSPHFSLGQFLCKQQPGSSRTYMLIQPGMLMKLERILEAANKKGWQVNTLTVMSGFRTPAYNKAIGNSTTSSRHLYGGAADVFIDADGDGRMDDLNGDGVVDGRDAMALADLAEAVAGKDHASWSAGGLAAYPENSAHGPFVHVDVRGYRARWGL
jgi:hypothetical protein